MQISRGLRLVKHNGLFNSLTANIKKHPWLYVMAVPVLAFYIIFHYMPMYGALIAFKNYVPAKGILGSPWAPMYGLQHFYSFLAGPYFGRLLRNTLLLSIYDILFNFTASILFAILLNELRSEKYRKVVQTLTYLPHFISIMVVCGLINTFVGREGLINDFIAFFGGERSNLLADPDKFRPLFIVSNIWQGIGWNSIVYLAALTNVDQQIYEAATIDGAGKLRKIWNVTMPGIMPTIIIMFILRMGTLLTVGYEKIILLYNPLTYETADVISSFVYRRGLIENNYSFSAAVGLLNSFVNFAMVWLTNAVIRQVSDTSLW